MKTLKSHTEQVIQKFRDRFSKHDCGESCFTDYGCSGIKTVREDIDYEELESFIEKQLKELSDLQAEETRVEKKNSTEECERAGCGGRTICNYHEYQDMGHNSAVEEQEKLSNTFRNL